MVTGRSAIEVGSYDGVKKLRFRFPLTSILSSLGEEVNEENSPGQG
jgi:hypothetical protein